MIDITEVIDKSYKLALSIKEGKFYQELLKRYNILLSDEKGKDLIKNFNEEKEKYNSSSSKENTKSLSIAKKNLYEYSLYKDYKKALDDYNDSIKEIENTINDHIFSESLNEVLKRSKAK